MLKTRKKIATLAIATAMSGAAYMAAAPVHALNVAQDGLGEVLFFPYYTAKGSFDTVFTVTNTTNKTAVFKVRFREALNSREVRDFNVILSPNDHWNAAITSNNGTGAVVRTFDKTCTSPILPESLTMPGSREIDFTDYLYTSASSSLTPGGEDKGGTDPERVQEGYFEVFLMGVSSASVTDTNNVIEYGAKHVDGVPHDCTAVDNAFLSAPAKTNPNSGDWRHFGPPQDILKGHVMYINVANGQSIDAEPTAIQHWLDGVEAIYAPGDLLPSLAQGDQTNATGFASGVAATAYTKAMANPTDAASAVLSAEAIINEYASGAGAFTSWVVTFPTKHHYTDDGLASPVAPFAQLFKTAGKSCDTVTVTLFDREEKSVTPSGTAFSPIQTAAGTQLCYEVNVVDFNGSSIFGTGVNHIGLNTSSIGTSGWARLGLTNTGNLGGNTTINGLPAIGFSAQIRTSGDATINYGGNTSHAFEVGHH